MHPDYTQVNFFVRGIETDLMILAESPALSVRE
jgi:hypothetical protein